MKDKIKCSFIVFDNYNKHRIFYNRQQQLQPPVLMYAIPDKVAHKLLKQRDSVKLEAQNG